jgi:hypothetical protein
MSLSDPHRVKDVEVFAEKYYSWKLYNLSFLISAAYLITLVLAE